MKRQNKGFTLIELLATIIILGLLVTIAYISVSSILNSGNENYYQTQENMLVLAGREYYADHRSELPKEIGEVSFVTLETLIDENYIDPIVDEDGNECNRTTSGVTAQKITDQDYQYYATLICNTYETTGDKSSPTISFSPNKKSSEDSITVTMKITDNSEVASYRYVITKDGDTYYDSTYQTYTGDIEIELTELGLYTITGYAIDSSGNTATRKSGQYSVYEGIDCSTVQITSSTDAGVITNEDISINFTLPSDTYRVEISKRTDGGEYELINSYIGNTISNIVLNTEGTHQVKAVIYDSNGNSCTAATEEYIIDKTGPELSVISKKKTDSTDLTTDDDISDLEDYLNDTWYSGYVVIRGSCSDDNGDCTISYEVTGASTNTDGFVEKDTRNINAEGTSYVTFRATDEAGNVTERTYTIKLSRSKPTLTVTLKKKKNSTDLDDSSDISSLSSYSNNTWYNGYVVARGSCSSASDCTISYKVTGASTNTDGYVSKTTRNINAQGTTTIEFVATDAVGNTTTKTYTIKLDRTAPTVTYNYSGGTYEKSSLKVCATINDSVGLDSAIVQVYTPSTSGTRLTKLSYSSINSTSKEICYTLSGHGTYTFYTRAYDLAGNKQSKSPENSYGYYYQQYVLKSSKSVSILNSSYYVCPNDQNVPTRSQCSSGQYNTLYVSNVKKSDLTVSFTIKLHMNNTETSCYQGQTNTLCIANSSNTCVKTLATFDIDCTPLWTSPGTNVINKTYTVDVSDWSAGTYRIIVDGSTTKFRFKTSSYVLDTFKITS